ncbi:unnamed protein product, partial [Rangifer tarandus platyrhynchus]
VIYMCVCVVYVYKCLCMCGYIYLNVYLLCINIYVYTHKYIYTYVYVCRCVSLRFLLHLAGSAIFRVLFLCTLFFLSFLICSRKTLFYLITYLFIYFVKSLPCALEPAPFFSECLL